jgi:hypothetical protein
MICLKESKQKFVFFHHVSFKIQSTLIRCKYEVQCGDSADYGHEDGACNKKKKKMFQQKKGEMEEEKQDSRSKIFVINDVAMMQ